MPELSEETREYFAAKKRLERRVTLSVLGTGAAIVATSWLGLPAAAPYIFTLGCLATYAFIVDHSIDAAVRRAREQ